MGKKYCQNPIQINYLYTKCNLTDLVWPIDKSTYVNQIVLAVRTLIRQLLVYCRLKRTLERLIGFLT